MGSGVKLIFKMLILTIVTVVVGCLAIEMYNTYTTSSQINRITDISIKQSCELFAQETYKDRDSGSAGAIGMKNIVDKDGVSVLSGNFYNGSDVAEVYKNLYTSGEFKAWCKSGEISDKGNWMSIKVLNHSLNGEGAGDYSEYEDLGKTYEEDMMTPLNMGVPYMDKETLLKMVKWNMAQLFSNCDSDLIHSGADDKYGRAYVLFKGYKVYLKDVEINKLTYQVFDLTNSGDAKKFEDITHMKPDGLGIEQSDSMIRADKDERNRICILGVDYSVPISYEGITPIKKAFEFAWNKDVEGMNGFNQRTANAETYDQDTAQKLKSGGFGGSVTPSGELPVPGKVIYYIVR